MVKLQLLGSVYYLTEGWLTFMRENGVQEGDQLCLRHLGHGRYKMQVFSSEGVFRPEAKTATRIPTRFDPSRFGEAEEADEVEEDYQVDRAELSDGTIDDDMLLVDVVNDMLVDDCGEEDEEEDGDEDDDDDVEDANETDSEEEFWTPPASFQKIVTHHNAGFPKKQGVLVPRLHEDWEPKRGHRGRVELTWENGGSRIFQCAYHCGKQWRIGAGWADWVRVVGLEIDNVLDFELRAYGETPEYHVTIIR